MAGFQEVMRQWKRLCMESHGENACANCPCSKDEYALFCDAIYDTPNDTNWPFIETAVMSWAAEHPEPVYPTFAEWMYDSFLKWCQRNYPGRAKDEKAWFDYIYETRIPAYIAEKLGLQPKEESK